MTPLNYCWVGRAGCGLGLLVCALLAGCANSPPWGGISRSPTPGQIQVALGWQTDYVYYPGYEIYHSNHNEYIYWDGRAWVSGIEPPRGVPLDVLLASPSVAMNFHDSPEQHHAATVRRYPHNWGSGEAVVLTSR